MKRAVVPAAGRQPFQDNGENQHQNRGFDEAGNDHAGHRQRHQRVIRPSVLFQGGEDAQKQAADNGDYEGVKADFH